MLLLWTAGAGAAAFSGGVSRPWFAGRRAPAAALLADESSSWVYGPPQRHAKKPSVAEQEQAAKDEAAAAAEGNGDGYVFGRESLESCIAALKSGSIVLLTEDGGEETRGLLVAPPTMSVLLGGATRAATWTASSICISVSAGASRRQQRCDLRCRRAC